ncbi:response regulator transcription factor [Streptomyces sp. H27-H1]|uniref:response regulator n=1 Tax=Streptomyces sp. H27-H1 TaxID=2996461 RepID=UPI00226EC3D7|nr:response regulator transcription factor [Streptomyces sp. H27-H1]MCY0929348.1 response regulator transcription factor [Streptomyces sp. H27-H1]
MTTATTTATAKTSATTTATTAVPTTATATKGPLRIILADDHTVMRAGLVALLSSEPTIDIVGEAGDGREAVRLVEQLEPDVALLDLRMPVLDGVGATVEIVGSRARTQVLILTTYDTDADIERGVEAGATGYLLKDATRDQLVEAIHSASRGETVLAPRVAQRLVAKMRQPAPVTLTARESEVLGAVADGLSNADIGRRLFIGEATVKTHLLRIFAKLDVSDRTRAVVVAMNSGLLPGR